MRRHPRILQRLAEGSLTLTSVCLLAPVLNEQNSLELLDAARHKSKREVEQLVARVRPQPPVASTVRKLLTPMQKAATRTAGSGAAAASTALVPASTSAPVLCDSALPLIVPPDAQPMISTPAQRPVVRPLAPETYRVQFTLSREGHDRLRRAQDLLRYTVPNGDVAVIFERALAVLVEDLEKKKLAATAWPRRGRPASAGSRHIPAAVRREVWRRDGGRCAFVGTEGRCTEREFLEIHHVVPFADGGETSVENLQLRCASHNAHEAELWFGASGVGFVKEEAGAYG